MGKRFTVPPFTFEQTGSPPIKPVFVWADYTHPPLIKGRYFDKESARSFGAAWDRTVAYLNNRPPVGRMHEMLLSPTRVIGFNDIDFDPAVLVADLRTELEIHFWIFDRAAASDVGRVLYYALDAMDEGEFGGHDQEFTLVPGGTSS